MKWHEALSGLMNGTALAPLLPLTAVSESHIQTGSVSSVSSTTAHVNFKIVIPQVLYLQGRGHDPGSHRDRHGRATSALTGRTR
jgi:hypothetical protein